MPPRAGLPERTLPATHGREPPSAACSLGAKFAGSPWGGKWGVGSREPEGRRWEPAATHLPSPGVSFDGVPRCGPPPPRQVLSPAGRCPCPGPQASQPVPAGNDCKSTLLFELPLGPPHRSPPVGGGGALSRQPSGAGTEPGYYRASGRSLPGGCLRPGSYVGARVCIRVCVRERESVGVCASRRGEPSPRGTRR